MIQLSQSAVSEILRLRAKRSNPHLLLRLGVEQRGCLEMSYSLSFDEAAQGGDQIIDCAEIQVIIATSSLPYVKGLVIDYSEDLMGGGFRFHNPQALQSCGCGNSFSVAEVP